MIRLRIVTFLFGAITLMMGFAEAASAGELGIEIISSAEAAKLFREGRMPNAEDLNTKWFCTYEHNGQVRFGGNYAFKTINDRPYLLDLSYSTRISVSERGHSILGLQPRGDSKKFYIAFRSALYANHRRLVIEESSNLESLQTQGRTSPVTGYASYSYTVCRPADELVDLKFPFEKK